jgi:hypothetical protein
MARALHIHFEQHAIVAERRRRFALGGRERGFELGLAFHLAHAFAAAAGDGFDQHRIADCVGFLCQALFALIFAEITGRYRHAGFGHEFLGGVLEAHGANGVRLRADPDEARIDDGLREIRVLGEKAVARMDRLGARLLGGRDDLFAAEIAFFRRTCADVHGFVRFAHVQRFCICVGIDRDGADAETFCRADDAAGDLATVCDQNTVQHAKLSSSFRGVAQRRTRNPGANDGSAAPGFRIATSSRPE